MKAAIYCRVSTDDQAEHGTSLGTQEERCRVYVKGKKWRLVEAFIDEGVSGAKESRPELDRLLSACRSGEVEVVVVTKHDRLARSLLNALLLMRDLDAMGVSVEFTDEPNEKGLMRNLRFAIAEDERDRIRDRTMAGRIARAREGQWVGGPPPFGFRIEDKHLVENEEEAATIRLAASLLIDEGHSTNEASSTLNALSHLPRVKGRWTHEDLRRTLTKETLSGRHVWNLNGEGEQIPCEIPAILSPERFADLQVALRATGHGPHARKQTYPLSGHLVYPCGEGSHGMHDNRTGVRYYRCNGVVFDRGPRCGDRAIRAEALEQAVWDEVCALLTSEDRLLALADEYLGLRETQVEVEQDESQTLDAQIRKVERALTQDTVEAVKAGLPADVIRAVTEELTRELNALQARRAMIEGWKREGEQQSQRVQRLVELADVARERLPEMPLVEKKRVLDLLGVRVQILDAASRTTPVRLKIEGQFFDLAALLEKVSLNGDAFPTCMEPQGIVENAITRRRGVM
jgi:DNA invertase Pin-like site-specific DNA recombinase